MTTTSPTPAPAERPCEWFALCDEPATHNEPHPAFPDGVPTCDRHGEWIKSMS